MRYQGCKTLKPNLKLKPKYVSCSFTVLFFSFTGASACVHLERFDEAITWCDKGLAVSFTKVDEIIFSKRLCSCHTPYKTYKLGTRKVHLVMVFSVNTNTKNIGCVPLGWSGSVSVIQDHSDHGRSNEPMNPLWTSIHRFIWCTVIQVISDLCSWSLSSQRNAPTALKS